MGLFDKVKQMTESANFDSAFEKIKSIGEIKSVIIEKVVSVDYTKVLDHLNSNKSTYPRTDLLISTIETLQEAAEIYKTSESPCKENDFMLYLVTNIDPEKVINELEPISNFIPMGNLILMILKYLLKYKKSK
jgi:hypothetical protein